MASLLERIAARDAAAGSTGPAAPASNPGVIEQPGGGGLLARVKRREALMQDREAETRAGAFKDSGVDPGPLGPPGLEDTALRADLGLSDTFDEKRGKFMTAFPEGDFIKSDDELLFRKNPNESFARVDAGLLEKFEFFGDLADLTGEMPAAIAEALFMRGGSIVKQMGRAALGSVTGDAVKETVEEFRGVQKELLKQQAGRIATRGLVAGIGTGLTTAITGPLNIISGRANIQLKPGSASAQKAAKDLGVPPLMPNQVGQNPIIQKLGGQAGATTTSIQTYIDSQFNAMVGALGRLRDVDRIRFVRDDVRQLHGDAKSQILTAARQSDQTLRDGGLAIQQGIVEYDELSRAVINRSYQKARDFESPEFDIDPILQVADEVVAGVQAAKRGGTETVQLSPAASELSSVVDDLRQINPELPTVELPNGMKFDSTEQLRALQQRLWDLKTTAPGEIRRQEHVQAGRLYTAIGEVLRNPKNASEEFTAAWRSANQEAAQRFDTLEKLMIIRAQRDETPTLLAKRLAQPGQIDNLMLLKDTIPEARWNELREATRADFVREENIGRLTKRLASFDRETLTTLFTPDEVGSLRGIGESFDSLERVGIEGILRDQVKAGAVIDELVESGSTAAVQQLREAANPAQTRTIRAGMMENIVSRVVKTIENRKVIDGKELKNQINRLRESGAVRFLTVRDLQTLRNLDRIVDFIPAKTDTGSSLQAGEAVAGVRSLSLSAMQTLLENIGTGRFLTSTLAQKLMAGTGGKKLEFRSIRTAGAIIANVIAGVDGEKEDE